MAKILLIEQQVIVREAIRHFLFPEHEVMARDAWPTPEELLAHAAVIIDTATLLQIGKDQKDAETLLAQAKIPTLWLCPQDAELPESNALCKFVRKPLDAKVLTSALRDLLPARSEAGGREEDTRESDTIVELTEIIEEGLPDKEKN